MHVTIRSYPAATALAEAMTSKVSELQEILRGVPGFITYYALRDGDNMTSITVCEDKAGTDESNRRAAEWVKKNLPQGAVQAPRISHGDTFVQFAK